MTAELETPKPTLAKLAFYFLRLGGTGFGGPIALANRMHSHIVEQEQWLSEADYNEGLAIASACPGPLAYQLAIYCGYVLKGIPGALSVAVAFASFPFCFVVTMGVLYTQFAATWQMKALYAGVAPVVVALVAKSCYQLAKKLLGKNAIAIVIAVVCAGITIATSQELVLLFLLSGIIGMCVFRIESNCSDTSNPPSETGLALPFACFVTLVAVAIALSFAPIDKLTLPLGLKLFAFFFRTGLMIFGSGIVIVPFLNEYVVTQYHWLSQEAFLDAVAVGLITPGPVVITATFVGFVLAGIGGAISATVGIFAPAVLFTIIGTPLLRAHRNNRLLKGFIRGITVAVVGVLLGTAIVLAKSTLYDSFRAIIGMASLVALFALPKVPEQFIVVTGAICSLAWCWITRMH